MFLNVISFFFLSPIRSPIFNFTVTLSFFLSFFLFSFALRLLYLYFMEFVFFFNIFMFEFQENGVDFGSFDGDDLRDFIDGRLASYDEVPKH